MIVMVIVFYEHDGGNVDDDDDGGGGATILNLNFDNKVDYDNVWKQWHIVSTLLQWAEYISNFFVCLKT